jgi:proline iminopeptidase
MDKYLTTNGVKLCYQELGDASQEAILLIAGLGEQLGEWPDNFCTTLIEHGYRVIRYDNRDIGLSEKMSEPNYTLNDMAADAAGLLRTLKIARAHVIGMSMGGMIAQILCAEEPELVASLCLMMTSSGQAGLPGPTPAVLEILSKKSDGTIAGFNDNWMEGKRRIDSPAYPADDAELLHRANKNSERSYHPGGYMRHLVAIGSNGSRVAFLEKIICPTLVIHGVNDPLIPKECGEDIIKHISTARLKLVDGMGHNLPQELHQDLCDSIVENIKLSQQ